MAAQTAQHKVLRIGVIQGGKILTERLFKKRDPVTVGSDPKCDVVVRGEGVPAAFPLFELRAGAYVLGFTEEMTGRIQVGEGAAADLAALRSGAHRKGALHQVPLGEGARGKVQLGELTVLFQFVVPPPEPTRPTLPVGTRGGVSGFLVGVDRLFFGLLFGMLIASYTFVGLVRMREVTEAVTLEEIPDRMVKMIMPERPQERPQEEEKVEEVVAAKEEKKEAPDAAKEAPKGPVNRTELEKKVGAAGLLAVIGSEGDGSGALDDVLSSGTGPADVASALADATRVGVATVDNIGSQTRGGGAGSTAGIGDLGTTGGGNVQLAAKREVVVARVETMGGPDVESSAVDREAVARFVRSRIGGVKACYEKELKRNPSLKGKIVVRFLISTAGRITSVEIEENSLNPAVAACIRTIIRGWSLPFKPDEEVPVTFPFVFSPASA